jgi:cytochrome c-type biogenesis protein CcmH
MLRRFAALALVGALVGTLVALLLAVGAGAQESGPEVPLGDPALEARAVALHKQFRCLVCQNQSIAESNAGLARDLRQLVRERLAAGDSDDEVRAFLVARYGDWVLLAPPFKARTWLLWLGPLLILGLAGFGVVRWYRRGAARRSAPVPLSRTERRRLRDLLEDGDG